MPCEPKYIGWYVIVKASDDFYDENDWNYNKADDKIRKSVKNLRCYAYEVENVFVLKEGDQFDFPEALGQNDTYHYPCEEPMSKKKFIIKYANDLKTLDKFGEVKVCFGYLTQIG